MTSSKIRANVTAKNLEAFLELAASDEKSYLHKFTDIERQFLLRLEHLAKDIRRGCEVDTRIEKKLAEIEQEDREHLVINKNDVGDLNELLNLDGKDSTAHAEDTFELNRDIAKSLVNKLTKRTEEVTIEDSRTVSMLAEEIGFWLDRFEKPSTEKNK